MKSEANISNQKFHALNGVNDIPRSEIETIVDLAKQENNAEVIYRLSKVLRNNPDAKTFNMTIAKYPATGLNGAQHSGDYKEALDDCGRLRPGYRFMGGKVVKVLTKKEKYAAAKEIAAKIEKGKSPIDAVIEVGEKVGKKTPKKANKTAKKVVQVGKKVAVKKPKPKVYFVAKSKQAGKIRTKKAIVTIDNENKSPFKKSGTNIISDWLQKNKASKSFSEKPNFGEKEKEVDVNGQISLFGSKINDKIMYHSSIESPVKKIMDGAVINELGIHLGTKKTAHLIQKAKGGKIRKFKVSLKNPIIINDFARWEAFVVSNRLVKDNVITINEQKNILKKSGNEKDKALINLLKSKGYDGFIYENYFDGGGVSCVVFDKKQLTEIVEKQKPLKGIVESLATNLLANSLMAPAANSNPNSLASRMNQRANAKHEYYTVADKEISKFLGNIEKKTKESVAITIAGGQGSMKTRFCFQLMNALAQNYKVGHASIEEHPESALYFDKAKQYCNDKALHNISAPEINSIEDVHKLTRENDVIVIDSFSKLQEMDKNCQLDKDFRKAYNGKLFIIIYQLTSDGKMRGGAKSQFDGDCIAFIEKKPNYTENYVWWDKNRYQSTPELKYNIYSGKIQKEPEPEAPKQKDKPKTETFSFEIV